MSNTSTLPDEVPTARYCPLGVTPNRLPLPLLLLLLLPRDPPPPHGTLILACRCSSGTKAGVKVEVEVEADAGAEVEVEIEENSRGGAEAEVCGSSCCGGRARPHTWIRPSQDLTANLSSGNKEDTG